MKKDKKKSMVDSILANTTMSVAKQAKALAKKADKKKSGGKKAPLFYIFKLESRTSITGQVKWHFNKFTTDLFPLIEDFVKL